MSVRTSDESWNFLHLRNPQALRLGRQPLPTFRVQSRGPNFGQSIGKLAEYLV